MPQDYSQAAHWYQKAAEQGDSDAQYDLGLLYQEGKVAPPETPQAFRWVAKLLKMPGSEGYKQAAYWWKKAAEQNHVVAQYKLGLLYKEGRGVPKDEEKAHYWFLKAAEQGSTE
ncbi:MAG: tetratricopeptide repeat protein [Sphingobacteriia bacterium]